MSYKLIGSSEPKYLAATDILIGDMSNTNYEFLLYDRPVILLANDWLRKNFPDIGIKTDLNGLPAGIERSLRDPDEFKEQRRNWLKKTIFKPDSPASKRYINIIIEKSGIVNPSMVFIHGNDPVRKTNLIPLVEEAKKRGIVNSFVAKVDQEAEKDGTIYVAAHFIDLNIEKGYKVHIDHDLKGVATANLKYAIWDYKRNSFFSHINLHITPGEAGDRRTKLVLGPFSNRTCIGGYPKGDHLLQLNTDENKKMLYKELGFS